MDRSARTFNVLVFIENDMYVRNFIASGAFDLLMQQPDVGICVSEIVTKLRSLIPPEKIVGEYERSAANRRLIRRFNKRAIRALRDKSSTFDIKVKTGWPFGRYGPRDRLASHPFIFEHITRRLTVSRLRNNPTIESVIAKHRPELVVFPVTGVESTGSELIVLSREYGFTTFFLVNGWDNLSSKGIFPLAPDYLGAWGPQSLVDAVNIQGMRPHRVISLGCARYEPYFDRQRAKTSPFPFKYVLFAGSTVPNDEITPLRVFEEVIEEQGVSDIKVVYRPHPWREKRNCFDLFEPEAYKHAVLDPQVADAYFGEKRKGTESSSSQNFPKLGYYASLLDHALFAVSPMSSMTLEAALFDVPCLVLAHDDGRHLISGNLQAEYKHFEGGEEIPGWFFVRHLKDIGPSFAELLERFRDESPSTREFRPVLSSAMKRYLCFGDGRSYAQRLHEVTHLILAAMAKNAGRVTAEKPRCAEPGSDPPL